MNGPKSIEILKNATATTITIICLLTYHCIGKYFYVNVKTLNANNLLKPENSILRIFLLPYCPLYSSKYCYDVCETFWALWLVC